MIMTSPILVANRSHPHTPLNLSPAGSPHLRATKPLTGSSPSGSGSSTPLAPLPLSNGNAHRSYARAPTQRPYQPLLVSRGSAGAGKTIRDVSGDTRKFGLIVADIVESRSNELRKGALAEQSGETPLPRRGKSLGGSLAGSWEKERVEFIVDVPLWSPGCFQDLSTLHSLRDTTLSHTHSLLSFLLRDHSIPASYRLLARSANANKPHHAAWGCIRLAPTSTSATGAPMRRSSFIQPNQKPSLTVSKSSPTVVIEHVETQIHSPTSRVHSRARMSPVLALEQAVADSDDDDDDGDEDEDGTVLLKEGYSSGSTSGSGSASDDEDEEDADVLVAREMQKRGTKSGDAFLMTLFGGPALILT